MALKNWKKKLCIWFTFGFPVRNMRHVLQWVLIFFFFKNCIFFCCSLRHWQVLTSFLENSQHHMEIPNVWQINKDSFLSGHVCSLADGWRERKKKYLQFMWLSYSEFKQKTVALKICFQRKSLKNLRTKMIMKNNLTAFH